MVMSSRPIKFEEIISSKKLDFQEVTAGTEIANLW